MPNARMHPLPSPQPTPPAPTLPACPLRPPLYRLHLHPTRRYIFAVPGTGGDKYARALIDGAGD